MSTIFNDPPELKLPWDQVITYAVEVVPHWNPPVAWVTRRVQLHDAAITTRVHGPFTGAAAGSLARTIANGLNHYTRTPEIWQTLLFAECEYILARKDREVQSYEDDEIPF